MSSDEVNTLLSDYRARLADERHLRAACLAKLDECHALLGRIAYGDPGLRQRVGETILAAQKVLERHGVLRAAYEIQRGTFEGGPEPSACERGDL